VNNSAATDISEEVCLPFPPGCPAGQPGNTARLPRTFILNMRCFNLDFRVGGQCPSSKRILQMPTVVNDSSIRILPWAGNGVPPSKEGTS
jgi:hypothetical protein